MYVCVYILYVCWDAVLTHIRTTVSDVHTRTYTCTFVHVRTYGSAQAITSGGWIMKSISAIFTF